MTPSKETLEAKKTFVEEQKKMVEDKTHIVWDYDRDILSKDVGIKPGDLNIIVETIINNTLAEVERVVEEYKIAGGNYNCGEEGCCDTNPTDEREKWDIGEQIAYNTALANIKARIQEMFIK
jgi:hypothetical protein